MMNPIRYFRRRKRLQREALDEAAYLRRRFGDSARAAALEKLKRTDLTSWGRQVVTEAVKHLEQR